MHRLILVLTTLVLGVSFTGIAQTSSTLEFESGEGVQSLDVTVLEARIIDGFAQLDPQIIGPGTGILLDMGSDPAIAVASTNATAASDLMFISPNGTIITIVKSAAPGSLNTIELSNRIAAILQLPAGAASDLGILPGSSVSHEILNN